MRSNFIQALFDKLFIPDGKRFVVVFNHDGFLMSDDVKKALYDEYGVISFTGSSLDLRIVRELHYNKSEGEYILFVTKERFELLEDVAEDTSVLTFQLKSMFSSYLPAELLSAAPLEEVERQFDFPDVERLNGYKTPTVLGEGAGNIDSIEYLKWRWENNLSRLDFDKPTVWMNKAAEIIYTAIEKNWWGELKDEVRAVNEAFLEYLKINYVNIISSTCGVKSPRVVTHILPFMNKMQDEKSALVVVDGMNYWQSMMLVSSIKERLGIEAKVDCVYSWLPSVTELSRQAIFRGYIPDYSYAQSPANEAKLWREYWHDKGVQPFQQMYQHSEDFSVEGSVNRLGYVVTDLDDMMHVSFDYKYLYANTRTWIEEGYLLRNIRYLIDLGFKVYITTDHGNIETKGYKRLDARDKIGADLSKRHIIINDDIDRSVFESSYVGHLEQLDKDSRTYYAVGEESFTSGSRCVTHGGLHFLEVLIPFITIG